MICNFFFVTRIIQKGYFAIIIEATVTSFCIFYMHRVANFVEKKHCINYSMLQFKGQRSVDHVLKQLKDVVNNISSQLQPVFVSAIKLEKVNIKCSKRNLFVANQQLVTHELSAVCVIVLKFY